jgi:hypothetical protein
MPASLFDHQPRREAIGAVFARSARLALAGLLAAPALLGLASAAGVPVRAGVGPVYWLAALAGFGAAGWMAGRRLGIGPRRKAALAGAFISAGVIVTAAFRALQGVTGRESVLAVAAATLPAFSAGFALAGVLAASAIGINRIGAGGAAICAAGGLLGGVSAMLPFCWAWLRLDVPGGTFVVMTLAVVGFLGCLIAPFHIVGLVLDRERDRNGLARE